MNKVFRISSLLLVSLLLALPGCGSKNAETADTAPAVEPQPVAQRTISTASFTMAIPENWKENVGKTSVNILDENDQPRLAINVGKLAKKGAAAAVAAAKAKQLNGSAPAKVAPGVYSFTTENRAGDQVPSMLKARGMKYVLIQQFKGDDAAAATAADSLALK